MTKAPPAPLKHRAMGLGQAPGRGSALPPALCTVEVNGTEEHVYQPTSLPPTPLYR